MPRPRICTGLAKQLKLCVNAHRTHRSQCLLPRHASNQGRLSLRRRNTPLSSCRHQSTLTRAPHSTSSLDPRQELTRALQDLQKNAQSFVNISRVQLALRGLEQTPGQETIRIAVLGLGDQRQTVQKTKELVRLLVADPLADQQEWEWKLIDEECDSPILLKVGHGEPEDGLMSSNRLVKEVYASSPVLNSHNVEILVLQSEALDEHTTDSILIPTVEIPTSSTGRYTPITTPVHLAIVMADGINGAASVLNISKSINSSTIMTAVDMHGYLPEDRVSFEIIDIALAKSALVAFRKSVDNALDYERDWFSSGLPTLAEWIKSNTVSSTNIKSPLSSLISSVIAESRSRIFESESVQLSNALSEKVSGTVLRSLNESLSIWAQRAHTELRDTLEAAFAGRRWRKLGWWKLFWRVDDVSMIASDILLQRFMPEAEKEIIYLAGKIDEAGVIQKMPDLALQEKNWAYKAVTMNDAGEAIMGTPPPPPRFVDLVDAKDDNEMQSLKPQPWPLHIPVTRGYLLSETVPALQALAQKLVLQTMTTSSFATAFSILIYIADTTTGIYESGAVAALGTVWALRRMQGKWEKAREYWEGEVREEGRKSIRAVEGVVGNVLKEPKVGNIIERRDIDEAKGAVARLEMALKKATEVK